VVDFGFRFAVISPRVLCTMEHIVFLRYIFFSNVTCVRYDFLKLLAKLLRYSKHNATDKDGVTMMYFLILTGTQVA